MKIYIIIQGENKNPPYFAEASQIYKELLKEGIVEKVIYSTGKEDSRCHCNGGARSCDWSGDCAEMDLLKDFSIIATPMDNIDFFLKDGSRDAFNSLKGHGNCWVQVQQLEHALNSLPDEEDVFVLKTRPDVIISIELIKKIFETISTQPINCPQTGLRNRLWYPWFDLTKPFYIADECFAGHLSDLKKFINYRTREYSHYFLGITHVRRSIEPFLEPYPLLQDYLKNEGDCLRSLTSLGINRQRNALELLKTDLYLNYLAHYYFILHKYFFISSPSGHVKFRPWSDCPRKILPTATIEENVKMGTWFMAAFIMGYNDEFLNNMVGGRIKSRVYDFIQEINGGTCIHDK